MSEQKNQQKQPPKRATSGIFAILMALLLLILGQQGILPLGDTADAPVLNWTQLCNPFRVLQTWLPYLARPASRPAVPCISFLRRFQLAR